LGNQNFFVIKQADSKKIVVDKGDQKFSGIA
jgi:hypothetical protein